MWVSSPRTCCRTVSTFYGLHGYITPAYLHFPVEFRSLLYPMSGELRAYLLAHYKFQSLS